MRDNSPTCRCPRNSVSHIDNTQKCHIVKLYETSSKLFDKQNNRVFSLQGPTHIKRAATEKLREVFTKYASQEVQGERFMTSEDFVRRYLGLFPEATYNKVSVTLPLTSARSVYYEC